MLTFVVEVVPDGTSSIDVKVVGIFVRILFIGVPAVFFILSI